MYKWYLPTLSEIIQSGESDVIQATRSKSPSDQAEHQWYGAIATLNILLGQYQSSAPLQANELDLGVLPGREPGLDPGLEPGLESENTLDTSIRGLILSGPFPIISHLDLRAHFSTWTLTGDPSLQAGSLQLPAANVTARANQRSIPHSSILPSAEHTLRLHPDDPLAVEPFCLVLSPQLSMILTLGLDEHHQPQFFFSFDPNTIWQGWRALRSRLQLTSPDILPRIEWIADQCSPTSPDYRLVMEFSQLMMMQTPNSQARRVRRSRSIRTERTGLRENSRKRRSKPSSRQDPSSSNALTRDAQGRDKESAYSENEQKLPPYPAKPLNVNRLDRLKLDDVSWTVAKPEPVNPNASPSVSQASTQDKHPLPGTRSQSAKSSPNPAHRPSSTPKNEIHQAHIGSDVELLKAIAHEVRTPLTTIRTLTRLLMKRKDLVDIVVKRLDQIDRECTKQIDRFSLIFKAVELATTSAHHAPNHLAKTSLANMFQQNVSRWKQQAQQRHLTLEVALPPTLPLVMSDPTVLDQVLTGLMDRMTHTLPPGTLIQLSVVPAGHQLKLQFWAKPQAKEASCQSSSQPTVSSPSLDRAETTNNRVGETDKSHPSIFAPTLQAVGQLLMFQPETGNLSLNLDVTKNLFQSLGGKLIVRHTPTKGEVLTIFLPMDDTESNSLSPSLKSKYFC